MGADGVDAEDDVIAFARRDTDETAITARFHREIAARGGEREFAGDDVLALRLGFVRRQADADDFRLGETDGGNRDRIEHAAMAGDQFGHHLALGGRLVGQQRLADDIADRPDAAHAGAALVIDLYETAIDQFQPHCLDAPTLQAGLAADGDEDLVGLDALGRALGVFVFEEGLLALGNDALRLAGEVHIDLVLLQPHRDRTGDLLVIDRQDGRRRLDKGDLGAELAHRNAQFQTDIAGADNDESFRQFGQIERLGRTDHGFAKRQEGQFDLDRAGGDDDILGIDLDLAAILEIDDTGLGTVEFGPAGNVFRTGCLEQLRDTAGQLGDDAVLPAFQLAHVEGRCGSEGNPQRIAAGMFAHILELARRMDDGLGGNTAAIEAGAPEPVPVDDNDIKAQLAGADRGGITARAAADNEKLAIALFHRKGSITAAQIMGRDLTARRSKGKARH